MASNFSLKLRSRGGAVILIRSSRFLKVAREVGECSLIGKTCRYWLRGHVRVLLQAAIVWRCLLFFLQISRLAPREGRGAWRSVLRARQESSVDVRIGGCPTQKWGKQDAAFLRVHCKWGNKNGRGETALLLSLGVQDLRFSWGPPPCRFL